MSVMIITGNYTFTARLHEDGVAAYSVCCYLFPLVFMFGNAIAQSSLPIISYNHGSGDTARIRKTFRLSLSLAFVLGLLMTLGGLFLAAPMVSIFLKPGTAAWAICKEGLPLFSLSYVFFTMNVVLVGYLQSLERSRAATFFMLLRSCILLVPAFLLLPPLLGNDGLWLAVPLSEALTALALLVTLGWKAMVRQR
jgi:Na+-driven multidrug efflux pump